jgi:hypothetical protein
VLAALCRATTASADAEPEPIRLHYTAPAGCPTREAFVGRLKTRTTKFREALEGEVARVFTVELASTGDAAKGRLTVGATDGSSATREVRAATCEQVEAALALVVAVAIDPQALLDPAPPNEPEPRPPTPAAPAPPPASPASAEITRPPEGSRPVADRRPYHLAMGLRWDEMSGITPLLRPVLRPFVEWGMGGRTVAPSFRLSFAWTRNAHVAAGTNAADVSWYAARVEGCPLRIGSEALSLAPCVTFDAGALRVAGENPAVPARTRPWLSAGLDARATARLWRWLFAELEAGAAAPWIKDRWVFADGTELHTAPPVAVWAGAGLACRFP